MANLRSGKAVRPNILLITCDQFRFPRFSYGPDGGFVEPLKQILGFQGGVDDSNPYAKFFPGLLRLRRNAVLLRNHMIAASACTPSRAVIYTGQYGTRTGVTQTDGLFKNGDSPNFPWLAADGIPTLGTWMRAAGYSTHYFGKWHVSNPPDRSLEHYGFGDWQESYPEPHGAQPNNLGVYRDVGFADSACAFLRRQGLALNYNRAYASMASADPDTDGPDTSEIPPWFAVASFTNPHDIAAYPGVIAQALPNDDPDSPGQTQSIFGPLTIPAQGDTTPAPAAGTMRIGLNPRDFPQDCANPAPTQGETLADKPRSQRDSAYKVGLGLAAKAGFNIVNSAGGGAPERDLNERLDAAVALALKSCIPFQLADDPNQGCSLFLQLYAWLHSVVDAHVDAVLTALEESGQADNTIVIFLADHGEYGGAHGMMLEKWYTAYEEALHVPVIVLFPGEDDAAARRSAAPEPAQIDALTSHIDILPTILGLAGIDAEQRRAIGAQLAMSRPVPPLPGIDLSGLLVKAAAGERVDAMLAGDDGRIREGVLFITDDEITAPLPPSRTAQEKHSYEEFAVYQAVVEAVRQGRHGKGPVDIAPGPVRQPNHVRCVRTDEYKLARYFDPSGQVPQEWEMYDLRRDPNERVNLVEISVSPPRARSDLPDSGRVQAQADSLAALLAELERRNL
jgi:arylsulfatase A-like enzyme